MASAKVPLDEQHITGSTGPAGRECTLPALHPDHKEERCFLPYKPPPVDSSAAHIEEFLEHAHFVSEDLEWLLSLPHDKFWCQAVFDESLQKCLDSYLRHAPRALEPPSCSSLAVAEMQRSVHRSVFMVFLRMATHKESKEHFITPAVFGEIIYNNFLFDIPKILDLCVLFGKGNSQLLHKMIENIFTQQPSYYSDLNETIPSVLQVLDTILERFGLQSEPATALEPLKLTAHSRPTAHTMPQEDLLDLVMYLCDTCTTLHSFLDIFPEACRTFQAHGFLSRLSSFYELAVPDVEKAVRKRNFDKSVQEDLWKRLAHSCKKMVEIAHLIVQHTCLQPILEGLFLFLMWCISLFRFLTDYDEEFPVADDISLLQQAFPHLDETRTSYLLEGVDSAYESVGRKKSGAHPPVGGTAGAQSESGAAWGAELSQVVRGAEAREDEGLVDGNDGPVCTVSSGELESLLSNVRDLLPDLGEGFILACLQEYGYNSEMVINNILENNLAPSLDKLDRALPRPIKAEANPVLSNRSNVFDDDEFDVFKRDQVDMSRIWKGRKQGPSGRALLEDKQHISEQRARYQAYETVVDEVPIGTNESGETGAAYVADDYEDEYDDTYDINQVGANDLDEDDDLLSRRPFTIPQALRTGRKAPEEEEDEGDEEVEKDNGTKRDLFIQDPAVLRERAEARRLAMQSRKGYRPPPTSHVMGGPKGQGQSQETLLDRRRKEASKSRGANHNRRSMADRKRNKGMIPS
uniref:CUE domain-containing protein n=1 Tax=Denticeps clupeoides TaxID=299321 RepID=A0AAY4CSZ0_9TELE